jgi:hypothetical protein
LWSRPSLILFPLLWVSPRPDVFGTNLFLS